MAKRRKKSDQDDFPEVEENQEDLVEENYTLRAYKKHEWSDDGLRYNVMKELPDSTPGSRHYATFFETKDLAIAKHECIAYFEDNNVTTLIFDRLDRNSEIIRHEADKEKIKDDEISEIQAEDQVKKIRKTKTRTVKRK